MNVLLLNILKASKSSVSHHWNGSFWNLKFTAPDSQRQLMNVCTTYLWVRVKVSLRWFDSFSDTWLTCPLEESYGSLSVSPYYICYEEASWSLDNAKKLSQFLLNHSYIPAIGLVPACRKHHRICEYKIFCLELDTLIFVKIWEKTK